MCALLLQPTVQGTRPSRTFYARGRILTHTNLPLPASRQFVTRRGPVQLNSCSRQTKQPGGPVWSQFQPGYSVKTIILNHRKLHRKVTEVQSAKTTVIHPTRGGHSAYCESSLWGTRQRASWPTETTDFQGYSSQIFHILAAKKSQELRDCTVKK